MVQTLMKFNSPTLKVATDQASLATGLSVECQVNSAAVTAAPSYSTIPATGCTGPTQSPGLTAYSLDLTWLQDWTVDGLSRFAWDNDGQQVAFELTPDVNDPTNKITGDAYAAAGSYGGAFGDGSAGQATSSWPCVGKPTLAPSTVP